MNSANGSRMTIRDLMSIMDKAEQDRYLLPHCSVCGDIKESFRHRDNVRQCIWTEGCIKHRIVCMNFRNEPVYQRCFCLPCRVDHSIAWHESAMLTEGRTQASTNYHAARLQWLKTL